MTEEQIQEIVERKYRNEFEKRKLSPDLLVKVISEYENILNDPDCFDTSNLEGLERTCKLLGAIVDTDFKREKSTIDDVYLSGYVRGVRTVLKIVLEEKKKLRAPFGNYL